MTAPADPAVPEARRRLGRVEFIAMMGTIFATVAFSIDAMLPALPQIATELSPEAANRAQLILTSFVLGMGLGTLVVGPLSDALGRKTLILMGAALYLAGAMLAYVAPSLELLLLARVIQGLGAAGPRVVSLAMIRDLYSGRGMAQIVSYAMMIFTLFPAVAPLIGAAIIAGFGWRSIFLAFVIFSLLSVGWITLRQPETLPRAARRKLSLRQTLTDMREAMAHRQMQLSILVQTVVFGVLFGALSSVQQLFDLTYGRGESFPVWFALIALMSAPAAPTNARLVMRLGMRPMIRSALWVSASLSFATALAVGVLQLGGAEFWVYFVWTVSIFATAAFTIGNLNALALEPLGHIAGTASSLMGALATVGGAILGAGLGQLYNGTPVPLAIGAGILLTAGALVMRTMPREGADAG
ncbi:MFS family multidrug efflux protein, similarity to bicyclomycin resistance protein Bcr [Roseibacterium elongatum DSM 19469]|uniref:MFS family multidrug efflux protein, similarity to bicyclomycin resistance protein Bcr n=1 Tax=Roseicyclus elongatus DSM 19469 TaxID=1294273 RepID=W8SRR9_9RHOB|nr:multidrug effflux MFS transporter [Roseibacterium elongatum]AHM05235.1 MFS family multidrug efflux protein, similarity to bicyclomycin resistance protein Bcr [Roseibacterium elongatum DSM 19469]